MRKILLTALFLLLPVLSVAQTFEATATITIKRKSDGANATQNKADKSLREDIARYVVHAAGGVVNPTQKDAQGNCLPFTLIIGSKTINVDIYNRNAETCAVAIVNNAPDLKSLNNLITILERLMRTQFNFLTDMQFLADSVAVAAKTAETNAANDVARVAEKVDVP